MVVGVIFTRKYKGVVRDKNKMDALVSRRSEAELTLLVEEKIASLRGAFGKNLHTHFLLESLERHIRLYGFSFSVDAVIDDYCNNVMRHDVDADVHDIRHWKKYVDYKFVKQIKGQGERVI